MYELHLKAFTNEETKIIQCRVIEHLLMLIKENYANGFDIVKIKNMNTIIDKSKWEVVLQNQLKS